MLKTVLNSLSVQVDKTMREWWGRDEGPRRYAGGCGRRLSAAIVNRPALCILTLLLLKIVLGFAWWRSGLNCVLDAKWDSAQFSSYFGTLWSVQATVTALVYPIVIAFVAVLLQRRATAKLSLQLYLRYALVLPAGISSLVLLALLGGEYVAVPYVDRAWIAMATVGDGAWFVANALLTAAFLFRTVRYVDDSVRLSVFTYYAASGALLSDVRARLSGLIFQNDQPDKENADKGERASKPPRVIYFPMGDGEKLVPLKVGGLRVIADVRLRLLRVAVDRWLRANRKAPAAQQAADSVAGGALLTIEFLPGETLTDSKSLCAVRGSVLPDRLTAFLIRRSVVLRRRTPSLSSMDFFDELCAETRALLEQHRHEAAAESIVGIADLHVELIKAARFVQDGDIVDNASLLAQPYDIGALRLHQEWLRAYRDLILLAASDANLNTSYYSRCCILCYHVSSHIRTEHIDIRTYALNLSTLLSHGLGIWWSGKADERNLVPRDSGRGVMLPPPLAGQYEAALSSFIEAWEYVPSEGRNAAGKSTGEVWKQCCDSVHFSKGYIDSTVKMFVEAVVRGDVIASRWLVDSYLKWWEGRGGDSNEYAGDDNDFPMHTIACCNDGWEKVRLTIENLPEGDEERVVAKDLASKVLKRYWIDSRIVCVLTLLGWTDDTDDMSALRFEMVMSLLAGRSYREGGTLADTDLTSFHTLLFHLIRAQVADSWYVGRMDELASVIEQAREPQRPGGRVYMMRGDSGMKGFMASQLELLVGVAGPRPRFGAPHLVEALPLWADDAQRLKELQGLVRELLSNLDSPTRLSRAQLQGRIRDELGNETSEEDAVVATRSALTDILTAITEANEDLVARATVSEGRIRLVSEVVSRHIVEQRNRFFPLSVSPSFTRVASAGNGNSVNFINVQKGAFTDPPLEASFNQRSTRFNEVVAERVCAAVLSGYLRNSNVNTLPSFDSDSFERVFLESAESIRRRGQTPVLVAPAHQAGSLLSRFRDAQRNGLRTTNFGYRQSEDPRSVVGYLEGVAIHSGVASDVSLYVVPLDDFLELEYGATESGNLVEVSWTAESRETIVLHFKWDVSAKIVDQ
jgi:hypothetical protein